MSKKILRFVALSLMAAIASLMFTMPTKAEVTTNISIPVNILVSIPCANGGAGEDVLLSGDLHVLITSTVNGNSVSGKIHNQPQGISGVGSVTGDKYQGTGVTQRNFRSSLANGSATLTFVNNFRMIGQGPGNNFLVHQVVHMTINANGDVTASVDNASIECK